MNSIAVGLTCWLVYVAKPRDRLLIMIFVLSIAFFAVWQAYRIGLLVGHNRARADAATEINKQLERDEQ